MSSGKSHNVQFFYIYMIDLIHLFDMFIGGDIVAFKLLHIFSLYCVLFDFKDASGSPMFSVKSQRHHI